MRVRAVVGLAVLSVGGMAVATPWAGAAPAEELSVSWVEAAWDAGDGSPASAVQVFEGTVDLGAGPEPFSFVSVVVPTTDGAGQTNCTTAEPVRFRTNLRKGIVAGTVTCGDGRSLDVDLKWTASDPLKGGGAHGYGEFEATATGVISDGTANLVPGPSTSASLGRQPVAPL